MEQAYQNAFQFVFKNVSEEDAEDELYSYVPPPTSEELELVLEDILLAIDDAASIFNEVAKEVRRLQRYQDLYPTRVAMKRFHTALRMKLQDNHRKTLDAANKMQNEACWKKIHQAEHVIELWLKHPTFQPHLKPWQQFMMEDAPGSGMNPRAKFLGKVPESDDFELSTASEDSDFHIFPPGGMALWADWCKEYEELEEKCRQVITKIAFFFTILYLTILHIDRHSRAFQFRANCRFRESIQLGITVHILTFPSFLGQ